MPVHYVTEHPSWLAVCGEAGGYQTTNEEEVTCPDCKSEIA